MINVTYPAETAPHPPTTDANRTSGNSAADLSIPSTHSPTSKAVIPDSPNSSADSLSSYTKNLTYTEHITVLFLGSRGVGKTCLVHSFLYNIFSDHHRPTVWDEYIRTIPYKLNSTGSVEHKLGLQVYDFGGGESERRFARAFLGEVDVVVICYAANGRESFNDVKSRWLPAIDGEKEGKKERTKKPVVFCCCKKDLRPKAVTKDNGVSAEEGQGLLRDLYFSHGNRVVHVECTSANISSTNAAWDRIIKHGFRCKYYSEPNLERRSDECQIA